MKPYRLKNHVAVAILIIILLYLVTETFAEILVRIVKPDSELISTILKFTVYAFFWFYIVPNWLDLPLARKSYREYLSDIRFAHFQPAGKLIFIIATSYGLIVLCQLAGSFSYYLNEPGEYVFNIGNNSLLDKGSVVAGVFEEIVWRGIILTLLLSKYTELKAILVSSAIFGAIHILNLANPQHPAIFHFSQVVWAFALGIMYAYLFIKLNSIWAPIILHYLSNALVGVWYINLDNTELLYSLYGVAFLGILPTLAVMLWVRHYLKKWPIIVSKLQ